MLSYHGLTLGSSPPYVSDLGSKERGGGGTYIIFAIVMLTNIFNPLKNPHLLEVKGVLEELALHYDCKHYFYACKISLTGEFFNQAVVGFKLQALALELGSLATYPSAVHVVALANWQAG